jgi:type IV secretory pathway VirD2 relaxase
MGNEDKRNDRLGDFRPRMGRTERARDRVATSSLRVATLVRRGHGRRGGKGAGKLPPASGFGPRHNARRVVVKAHVHKLGRLGAQAAARHLRYIERDGVEKDGSPGVLYGPEGPAACERFEEPRPGERHQFRFIVSPEDARDLDLTSYVRELMARVERDLGRSIEWAAVNHFDTEHAHAHVVVRGVCREGRQLRMDRTYIARGFRWSAQELATERLGPRLEIEIRAARERDVPLERFTSLDRELEQAVADRRVDAASLVPRRHFPEPALLVRRLEQLERFGLAEKVAPSGWLLAEGWQGQLRELGERGDVLKQMHLAMHGGDTKRFHVVRRGQALPDGQGGVDERTLVGRVVRKGLTDELKGRSFYAVIETSTGDAYHLTLGARDVDALRAEDMISFGTKRAPAVQPVDRHLAEVAAARHGVYELTDTARESDFGRTAERRLRELERLALVTSPAPGQWRVPSDLREQLERRHHAAPGRYRVHIAALALPIDAQIGRQGPVWLDTLDPERLATKGFGAEVRAAVEGRRQALAKLGIAPNDPERDDKIRDLERRAVGREIARQSGQQFVESAPSLFRGRLEPVAEGAPFAPVTDGVRFVLVSNTKGARSRTGEIVDVVGDWSGRPVLAEELAARLELARAAAGETIARETGMAFLRTIPAGFSGRVQPGPPDSPYLAVSDGARFVLVPATPQARTLHGRTVEVTRDVHGHFVGLRAPGLDRWR